MNCAVAQMIGNLLGLIIASKFIADFMFYRALGVFILRVGLCLTKQVNDFF